MFKKNKHGEAYIDTIITVVLSLMIIAISIGLFQTMYNYQKLNDIATSTLEYASIQGKISNNNEVTKKLEELITANGFELDDIEYSFNSSELIVTNGDYTEKVQYGDTIHMNIKTQVQFGFINNDGFLTIPIEISKSALSQHYWK